MVTAIAVVALILLLIMGWALLIVAAQSDGN